jgi:hypothetical protein
MVQWTTRIRAQTWRINWTRRARMELTFYIDSVGRWTLAAVLSKLNESRRSRYYVVWCHLTIFQRTSTLNTYRVPQTTLNLQRRTLPCRALLSNASLPLRQSGSAVFVIQLLHEKAKSTRTDGARRKSLGNALCGWSHWSVAHRRRRKAGIQLN